VTDGVVHVDHVVEDALRVDDPDGRLVMSVHSRDGLATPDLQRVRLVVPRST
jgi:hypothetical protein